VSNREFAQL